ncbi:alpha-hydroxy acid oxidase [Sedimentitalea sp.]|uniref:alpha-hydroxy acid oxidase n=1 Tax=Sedimentitalea sp. TaxID=2048915 RepID=UPI003298912E
MTTITCVEDFRQAYKRRVPKMFCDYADAGSYSESTYRANEADFGNLLIRQRVGIDISDVRMDTTLFGQKAKLPVCFAPVGMLGIQHAAGEIKVARAAEAYGVPFTLSTMSICSIEDVAGATKAPFWFQLYVVKDRAFNLDLIRRAKAAGCSALVVTMDLPMLGQRHKDIKNGLPIKIRPTLGNLVDLATKPTWGLQMARTPYKSFGNVIGHAKGVDNMHSLLTWAAEQVDPSLTWADIETFRKEWDGPLILKGIMDVEDAQIAADLGVDGIIVSNHGGRQQDGASSSIAYLPKIVDAVGDRVQIVMDSGVRSGQDIFRAIAMGASGTMLGRAMVYALGAMGENGVSTLLEILEKELRTTMGLAGKTDVAKVDATDVFQA